MVEMAMRINQLNRFKVIVFDELLKCFLFGGKIATGVYNNRFLFSFHNK